MKRVQMIIMLMFMQSCYSSESSHTMYQLSCKNKFERSILFQVQAVFTTKKFFSSTKQVLYPMCFVRLGYSARFDIPAGADVSVWVNGFPAGGFIKNGKIHMDDDYSVIAYEFNKDRGYFICDQKNQETSKSD